MESLTERGSVGAGLVELSLTQAAWGTLWPTTRLRPRADRRDYSHYGNTSDTQEFCGIVQWVITALQVCLGVFLLIVVAACTYMLFYRWIMPPEALVRSFSFDYNYADSRMPLVTESAAAIQQRKWIFHDTFPSPDLFSESWPPIAVIDLFARHNSWTAFSPDVAPSPTSLDRLLQPQQSYYIDLSLDLPESSTNKRAGIFGIVLQLHSSRNRTILAMARNSARLPHESAWVGVVRKIVVLPALLVGALEESRTVYMTPFRRYTESEEHPLQLVSICILGRHGEIEVTQAVIRIGEEMNEMQECLKDWYYTCFLAGTIIFMVFFVFCWILACGLKEYFSQVAFQMQEPPCDLDPADDDLHEADASQNDVHNSFDEAPSFVGPSDVDISGNTPGVQILDPIDPSRNLDQTDHMTQCSWEDIGS